MSGHICSFEAGTWHTAGHAKTIIAGLTGIPQAEQRLLLGSSILTDSRLLGEVVDGNAGVLSLMRRSAEQARWIQMILESEWSFQDAPPEMKADYEVAMAALQNPMHPHVNVGQNPYGYFSQCASPDWLASRDFVLAAVRVSAPRYVLPYVPRHFQEDKVIAVAAVHTDGMALEYLQPEFRADPDIVSAALNSRPSAIQFAPESFQIDPDVVLQVIRQSQHPYYDLGFVSEALFSNHEIMFAAARKDCNAYNLCPHDLKTNPQVMVAYCSLKHRNRARYIWNPNNKTLHDILCQEPFLPHDDKLLQMQMDCAAAFGRELLHGALQQEAPEANKVLQHGALQ